jgi:hypothetical protein
MYVSDRVHTSVPIGTGNITANNALAASCMWIPEVTIPIFKFGFNSDLGYKVLSSLIKEIFIN